METLKQITMLRDIGGAASDLYKKFGDTFKDDREASNLFAALSASKPLTLTLELVQ